MDERKPSDSNVKNFHKLLACMKDTLEYTDSQLNTIWRVLAAILIAGELTVSEDDEGQAKIDDNHLIGNSKFIGYARVVINIVMSIPPTRFPQHTLFLIL